MKTCCNAILVFGPLVKTWKYLVRSDTACCHIIKTKKKTHIKVAFIHIDYTVDSFYNIYNSEKWPFSNILLVKSFYISHLCSNSD